MASLPNFLGGTRYALIGRGFAGKLIKTTMGANGARNHALPTAPLSKRFGCHCEKEFPGLRFWRVVLYHMPFNHPFPVNR